MCAECGVMGEALRLRYASEAHGWTLLQMKNELKI